MNVGMLACYDQAKEVVAVVLNDPMTDGPSLATKMGSSCIAVSSTRVLHLLVSTGAVLNTS